MQNIFVFLLNLLYLYTIWYKMTEEDKKLLNTFEGKLRHFMYLFEELKKENTSLRQLLSDKEAEISRLDEKIKDLEIQYTNLKTARIISINDNELRDTKQRLARLVREVDKCIALLNE
jgi:predicted nuclease with TOPRIM domain